jgi:hypothetical protein
MNFTSLREKSKNRDVIWKIIEIKTQCELDEKIIQFKHITSNTKNKKKAEKKERNNTTTKNSIRNSNNNK